MEGIEVQAALSGDASTCLAGVGLRNRRLEARLNVQADACVTTECGIGIRT
jgi:hypothetical protein